MSINFPSADFTPQLQGYTGQGAFRFWCQKVLPLVYDDSLSYYELLNKVVVYLNNVIEDVSTVETNVGELNHSYTLLQTYVNSFKHTVETTVNNFERYLNEYFDNLDVQQEINNKLDAMAESGELSALVYPLIVNDIPSIVEQWLNDNITPTTPIIDKSLSVRGAGADALTVGDSFIGLGDMLARYGVIFPSNFELGSINTSTGAETDSTDGSRMRSSWYEFNSNTIVVRIANNSGDTITLFKCYYDQNGSFLSAVAETAIPDGNVGVFAVSPNNVTGASKFRIRASSGSNALTPNNTQIYADYQWGSIFSSQKLEGNSDLDTTPFLQNGSWAVTDVNLAPAHYPSPATGRIICFGTNSTTTSTRVQIVFDSNGDIWGRTSWTNGRWRSWFKFSKDGDLIGTALLYRGELSDATLDMNTGAFVEPGMWFLTDVVNKPQNYPSDEPGKIICFGGPSAATTGRIQIVFDRDNIIWIRESWTNGVWRDWNTIPMLKEVKENTIYNMGTLTDPTLDMDGGEFVHSGMWFLTDVANKPLNYPIDEPGRILCIGTPSGSTAGRVQIVFGFSNRIYIRESWTNGVWRDWRELALLQDVQDNSVYSKGNITEAGLNLNNEPFRRPGIWSVVNTNYMPKGSPTMNPCRIFVFSSGSSSLIYTWQIIKDNAGQTFWRFATGSGSFRNWQHEEAFHYGISFDSCFMYPSAFVCDNNNITQDDTASGRTARLYAMYDAETSDSVVIDKSSLGYDASNSMQVYLYKVRAANDSTKKPVVLIIYGEHGDELNSAMTGAYVYKEVVNGALTKWLEYVDFWFVPLMNPWGYENESRNNWNDVNLNRDFPALWTYSEVQHNKTANYSLSQPETRYIYNLLVENKDDILFVLNKHDTDTIYAKITANFKGVVGYCSTTMKEDLVVNNGLARHESAQIKITDPWIMGYTGVDMSKQTLISSVDLSPVGSLDLFANSIGIHGSLLETAYRAGNPAYGTPHLKELARLGVDFVCNWLVHTLMHNTDMLSSDDTMKTIRYYTRKEVDGSWVDVEMYWNGSELVEY